MEVVSSRVLVQNDLTAAKVVDDDVVQKINKEEELINKQHGQGETPGR